MIRIPENLGHDALAAFVVTIILVPQSLAYAMLAGLPPEAGLYASIFPLFVYSVFGSSNVLAVGPVAVLSMMTATTISTISAHSSASPSEIAVLLAGLSGMFLLLLGDLPIRLYRELFKSFGDQGFCPWVRGVDCARANL